MKKQKEKDLGFMGCSRFVLTSHSGLGSKNLFFPCSFIADHDIPKEVLMKYGKQ